MDAARRPLIEVGNVQTFAERSHKRSPLLRGTAALGKAWQMAAVFAIIGFIIGAIMGIAVFAIAIDGKRRTAYQAVAARQPWIRLLPVLCIVASGAVVAHVASRLVE
jgi:hypothetical protein